MAMIELWSINRVLRWTGFRLVVQKPTHTEAEPVDTDAVEARNMAGGEGAIDGDTAVSDTETTKLGLQWVGLYGSKGWMKWEPWTRPFWSRWRNALADKIRDVRAEAAEEGESTVKEIAQKIAGKALGIGKSADAGDGDGDGAGEAAEESAPRRRRSKTAPKSRRKRRGSGPKRPAPKPEAEQAGAESDASAEAQAAEPESDSNAVE